MRHDLRAVAGLLAALGTLVVALPLRSLFDDNPWVGPAMGGILLVMLSGMLLRGLTTRAGLVVLGQALVAGFYLLVTQLRETTWFGVVPTPQTISTFAAHVSDAHETITRYAAPAPATPGIVVMLVTVVVVVALAVDMSSATAMSPSVAGLPLLSLFLVSAANSGGSLHGLWFLVAASVWLAMVVHQADVDLHGWVTSVPRLARGDGEEVAARSHRWQAVRLGALGLAGAVALATFVPHLPTRYVLDGLGRGGSSVGGSGVRLASALDLRRSLASPSEEPVLTYTTSAPSPEPLRVAVVEDFSDGLGRMRSDAPEPVDGFSPVDPTLRIPGNIPAERRTIVVQSNGVAAPQLPLPSLVSSVDTGGIAWALGQDGTARVQQTPGTYSATFTELTPEEDDFDLETALPVDPSAADDSYLTLDPGSSTEISELVDEVVPQDATPLATAQAIQEYLRGSEFTYSLELPDAQGRDPIVSFLDTKTGYCQQFAVTMTLMARARGIPARVAVGFLPGSLSTGEERVVRVSDAHAWPELYFEGVGWTRFEPTPGSRAASTPGYSVDTTDSSAGSETSTSSDNASSSSASSADRPEDVAVPEAATGQDEGRPAWLTWLLWLLGAGLVLAIMPVSALVARRLDRRRSLDDTERVEREWHELVSQLDDLGLRPPVGATPRQTGAWLSRRLHLEGEPQEHLDHVVATLERARYAPPGADLPDISREVGQVVDRVRASRQRSMQLRSVLWPQDGVDAWRTLGRAILRRLLRRG
ncbi:transglutaminaseTgpA domain-containing protein [Janibacter sp. G349]|uniref:transglutaminase family protein n=1 Tax=Janibacter sp. G349 TaxID=3405424 RepID=UPI003B7AF62D